MFGLGMPEILLILAIALMVIGPKKLPDLAKSLGRALGEFKKAAHEFKNSIDLDSTVKEFNEPVQNIKKDLKVFSDPLKKSSADSLKESFEQEKQATDITNESTDKLKKSSGLENVSGNKAQQKHDSAAESSDKRKETETIAPTIKENFERQDSESPENRDSSYGQNGSDKVVGLNKDEKVK
ncbi:MAG: twin-arginine translocase TatA/TatE family subunit [Desulfamplus sp.]|nr:twin-arginine translocase TatA/TatE family subunit [Desulfamplus sp.]